jgi:hypothetical protein
MSGTMAFESGYPVADISYSVRNYGTAVAFDEIDYAAPFATNDLIGAYRLFDQWCSGQHSTIGGADQTHDSEIAGKWGKTTLPPSMSTEGMAGEHRFQVLMGAIRPKITWVIVEVCIEYRAQTGPVHHTRYLYRGTWGAPPVEMSNFGWSYRQLTGFHLDRTGED